MMCCVLAMLAHNLKLRYLTSLSPRAQIAVFSTTRARVRKLVCRVMACTSVFKVASSATRSPPSLQRS